MKKRFFHKKLIAVCLAFAGARFANAQTIQLTPLDFGDTYEQHIDGERTISVSKIPEWSRTEKTSTWWLSSLSHTTENSNWIKIEATDFSSDSLYSLSKDSQENMWIVKSLQTSETPALYAMLDCEINTIEDVIGDYWVSWKVIEGSKDIYPVLHKG